MEKVIQMVFEEKILEVFNNLHNMFPNIKSRCPIFLNTERENECHRSITPEMVINKINEAIIFTNS